MSASVHRVDTPEEEDRSQDPNLSWVECVKDKSSSAELLEDQVTLMGSGDPISPPVCVNATGGGSVKIPHKHENKRVDTRRFDVCEVFFPPRVCPVATEQGARGGWSLDISVNGPGSGRSFDLRSSKDQKEARRMITRDQPTVLIVSPPCTAFSIANQGEIDPQTLAGAIEMIRFWIELCKLQHRAGRHFVFEQPQSSRAWSLDEVVGMTYTENASNTSFHQCMYGLVARDQLGPAPA